MTHLRSTNYEIRRVARCDYPRPEWWCGFAGVTTVTSVKVGAAVTISESGIEHQVLESLALVLMEHK